MTSLPFLQQSDEANWQGVEKVWASVQQFPERKERSSWWLVLVGVVLVGLALRAGL